MEPHKTTCKGIKLASLKIPKKIVKENQILAKWVSIKLQTIWFKASTEIASNKTITKEDQFPTKANHKSRKEPLWSIICWWMNKDPLFSTIRFISIIRLLKSILQPCLDSSPLHLISRLLLQASWYHKQSEMISSLTTQIKSVTKAIQSNLKTRLPNFLRITRILFSLWCPFLTLINKSRLILIWGKAVLKELAREHYLSKDLDLNKIFRSPFSNTKSETFKIYCSLSLIPKF